MSELELRSFINNLIDRKTSAQYEYDESNLKQSNTYLYWHGKTTAYEEIIQLLEEKLFILVQEKGK